MSAPSALLIKPNADDPVAAGITGTSPALTMAPPPSKICRLVKLPMCKFPLADDVVNGAVQTVPGIFLITLQYP
jgi:hypothetical protein